MTSIGAMPNFAETAGWRFSHSPRFVTPAARRRIRNSGSWSLAYWLVPQASPEAAGVRPVSNATLACREPSERMVEDCPWLGVASAVAVQIAAPPSMSMTRKRFIDLSDLSTVSRVPSRPRLDDVGGSRPAALLRTSLDRVGGGPGRPVGLHPLAAEACLPFAAGFPPRWISP